MDYIKYDKNQEIDLLNCLRDKERLRILNYNYYFSHKYLTVSLINLENTFNCFILFPTCSIM